MKLIEKILSIMMSVLFVEMIAISIQIFELKTINILKAGFIVLFVIGMGWLIALGLKVMEE